MAYKTNKSIKNVKTAGQVKIYNIDTTSKVQGDRNIKCFKSDDTVKDHSKYVDTSKRYKYSTKYMWLNLFFNNKWYVWTDF